MQRNTIITTQEMELTDNKNHSKPISLSGLSMFIVDKQLKEKNLKIVNNNLILTHIWEILLDY